MGPAMGPAHPRRGAAPCRKVVFQSSPLTPAFATTQSRQAVAAVSRLAGRNSVQMRTFLNPTVSRRGTSSSTLPFSRPSSSHVSAPQSGSGRKVDWGGGAFDRAGPLEIASRHDLALPARALPSASHVSPISQPCLPSSMLRMICVFRITSPQFFRTLPHHPPAPTSPALTPRPIYLSLLPILPFDIIPNRIDTNTAASSQPTSSRSST